MASVLEAIREVLRPGIFDESKLVLRETDPGSTFPEVALNKRGKALMLRPDQVPTKGMSAVDRLFPLFDTSKPGLCQLCDYLVFYPRPLVSGEVSDLFVFLFELKSGSPRGALAQLRQGKLLADYVLEVAFLFVQGVKRPHVHYRGVTFAAAAPRPRIVARHHEAFDWVVDAHSPELRVCSRRPPAAHDLDALCL